MKKVIAKTQEPVAGNLRFGQFRSPAINDMGEINAHSKKELMGQIRHLMTASMHGTISDDPREKQLARKQRKEALAAAANDPEKFEAIGQVMGDDIWMAVSRIAFSRSLLLNKDLDQGEEAYVNIKRKHATAIIATTPTNIETAIVRAGKRYLPEVYIMTRMLAEERDIQHASGDLLEEKFEEGLEAILTGEDRLWKQMADTAASIVNTVVYFSTFTPNHFAQIKGQVWGNSLTPAAAVLSYDLWEDMTSTSGFADWWDPVSQYEIVTNGTLGALQGIPLRTDAFRPAELKVLDPGEIYIVSSPETHGAFQQRGDMNSRVVNPERSVPMRGWEIFELVAMAIVNSASVSKAKRS